MAKIWGRLFNYLRPRSIRATPSVRVIKVPEPVTATETEKLETATMKLVLVGAHAGKDIILNGYKFEQGRLDIGSDLSSVSSLINYFKVAYNAHIEGSPELKAAMESYEAAIKEMAEAAELAAKEAANVGSSVLDGAGAGASGAPANEPSAKDGAELSGAASDDKGHATGDTAKGNGDSAGGLVSPFIESNDPQVLKVIDALKALNPDNNDHWTAQGLPAISVVAEASKVPGVSRKDVEQAAPGWNREKALSASL